MNKRSSKISPPSPKKRARELYRGDVHQLTPQFQVNGSFRRNGHQDPKRRKNVEEPLFLIPVQLKKDKRRPQEGNDIHIGEVPNILAETGRPVVCVENMLSPTDTEDTYGDADNLPEESLYETLRRNPSCTKESEDPIIIGTVRTYKRVGYKFIPQEQTFRLHSDGIVVVTNPDKSKDTCSPQGHWGTESTWMQGASKERR